MESHEGQCLQVGIGTELLRRRVVLVVLVAPVAARHAAAEAIDDHLQVAVDLDVARERVVAALVLQPAAAALRDAHHEHARPPTAAPDEDEARGVHGNHLADAVGHVREVGLKVPLLEQLLPELLKVLAESIFLVVSIDGTRGQ